MNKTLLPIFLAVASMTNPAFAQFTDPMNKIVSTKEAKALQNDMPVVMRGRIEKALGDEKYLFADSDGTIIVEIDFEDFRGVNVSSSDNIEIRGEVDSKLLRDNEIDVDYLEKINIETTN
jgi:uncharacterized protein (TIGR00156 family)